MDSAREVAKMDMRALAVPQLERIEANDGLLLHRYRCLAGEVQRHPFHPRWVELEGYGPTLAQ